MAEPEAAWVVPKCLLHAEPKRACVECKLHLDLTRATDNAARSHATLQKKIKAERRDKLEARIELALTENRRWQPMGFGCKLHKDKRCRCQELARIEFDNPGQRDGFIMEQEAEIKALGI
jgi:hypothetical protein